MTDQELLALYACRDPAAAEAMEAQYGAYCAGIVGRLLPDPRDCEECLNDVRLRAWKALEHHRPLYLKGWLGAVARNCAITRSRQLKRQAVQWEDSAAELAFALSDGPGERLEAQALGEAISAFLHTQPEAVRIAFVRRYWYGDTVEQTARHLGWSVSKTKSVLFRTRIKLRDYLNKEGLYDA